MWIYFVRSNHFFWICLLLNLMQHFSQNLGLIMHRLRIPSPVENGSAVFLHCDFSLTTQEASSYSVKFYKNNLEFYRFESIEDSIKPNQKHYPLLGVHVNTHASNGSHLLLQQVHSNTEGTYSCEVNTELPYFMSAKAQEDLRIYVLPNERLRLISDNLTRSKDDYVRLRCVSGATKPPTILSWYLNGRQIHNSPRVNISSEIILLEQDGLAITKSYLLLHLHSLQAHASSTSFWHLGQASNYIEIQCHSMLTQIAGQSYERLRVHENGEIERQSHSDSACGSLSIPVQRSKRYSVKNKLLPIRRMNKTTSKRKNSILIMDLSKAVRCGLKEQQVQFHTPHIVVQSSDFRIGQTVSLNCTMKASRPCAFLQWFLNHKPIAHSSLSSQHSNNGSLLTTNEYLFSRLLQSRASLHTGTSASTPYPIEDTYSSSTPEFSNNPLNPTFADPRMSTIYDHFAREDLTDQSLAIHFSVVKKHYQTVDASFSLQCMATHGRQIHKDRATIRLLSNGNQVSSFAQHSQSSKAYSLMPTWPFLYIFAIWMQFR